MNRSTIVAGSILAGVLGVVVATPLWAAAYDASEYQGLMKAATQKGVVRVLVSLDVDVTLDEIRKNRQAVKATADAKANALLAKLGGNALQNGVWNNGMGQIGVYVTPSGLRQLADSADVRSLLPDSTDGMRLGVYDGGRIAAIEAELDAKGFADVEFTLNLDNLDFDIGPNGSTLHRTSKEQRDELKSRLPGFLNSLSERSVLNLANVRAQINDPTFQTPTKTLRISREGLYALKEHADVRAIRLVAEPAAAPPNLDPEALVIAKKEGVAEVIIELRRPAAYTPLKGKVSAKAWQSQSDAIRRSFVEILSGAGAGVTSAQEFHGLAGVAVKLSPTALARLYQSPDSRVGSIVLNKGVADPLLNVSAPMIGMPVAWNSNPALTGSGQTIAVFDTGIQATHPFLQNSNGIPKVFFEACFGTTDGTYETYCPSWNAVGDSPLGLAGSGAPCTGHPSCTHGTHVAGIAAGRNGTTPNGVVLNGIAPDAQLLSVQVFSRRRTTNSPSATMVDLIAGTGALAGAQYSEVTANFSLGRTNTLFAADCPNPYPNTDPALSSQTFTDSIALLLSLNVPVVAATGNDSSRTGIKWPACVPNVIKVAGVCTAGWNFTDITTGAFLGTCQRDELYPLSNIAPGQFTGPILLAPGAVINSSVPGSQYAQDHGTSMAAPHVAGFYAVFKQAAPGASVVDITAKILGTSPGPSFGVNIAVPGVGFFRRINVPQ